MAIIQVITEEFSAPDVNTEEILRYAGCRRGIDDTTRELLKEAIKEAEDLFVYKVCCLTADVTVTEDGISVCDEYFSSRLLAKTMKSCKKVIIFGATVGIAVDRLIMRYSRLSPAKAVLLQGYGAERIEALCDEFCISMQKKHPEYTFTSRFSPGYGDLDIKNQKTIFKMLNCEKNIGLFLNESMLMSPTKSVTAFVGMR